jgi:hypothetical protein
MCLCFQDQGERFKRVKVNVLQKPNGGFTRRNGAWYSDLDESKGDGHWRDPGDGETE